MELNNNNKLKIASDISQTSEYRNLPGKISDTYSQGKFRALPENLKSSLPSIGGLEAELGGCGMNG